ncbi:tetratricopeptide repeat protein [Stratiformator vulcanicus]|uniref:Uncharacterized protein n=1 Tax=Stratiformator vulcanicus TaxID=2527980 RepID=A0A517R7C0_9PLAN|nr:hypothetical protein [Stratiformator vulcanicus]QDT39787.1 hypothetical protein Pan189_41980 [Stratiformator vulcanicus]
MNLQQTFGRPREGALRRGLIRGLSVALIFIGLNCAVFAQPPRGSTKQLDNKAEQIRDEFVRETGLLAEEYERSGENDKAIVMLRRILDVRPDLVQAREKIKEIEERRLSANEVTTEIDVSRGWVGPITNVQKGKPFRISVTGDYRIVYSKLISGDGPPTSDDPATGLYDGIAFGRLMGIVAPAPQAASGRRPSGNRRGGNKNGGPPEPFVIGADASISPPESGPLYLRVNLPTDCRATGKLKATLTGNIGS